MQILTSWPAFWRKRVTVRPNVCSSSATSTRKPVAFMVYLWRRGGRRGRRCRPSGAGRRDHPRGCGAGSGRWRARDRPPAGHRRWRTARKTLALRLREGGGGVGDVEERSSVLRLAARTVRVPPAGIADAAFTARAMTTCLSESASIRAGGQASREARATRTRAKAGWRSSSLRASETVAPTSARRPDAGPRRVEQEAHDLLAAGDLAADEVPELARLARGAPGPPSRRARRAPPRSPAMPARGFEISWATPETSWPRKARRSEAMRRISSSRRSVMSSNQESDVRGLPAAAHRQPPDVVEAALRLDDLLVRPAACAAPRAGRARSLGSRRRPAPPRAGAPDAPGCAGGPSAPLSRRRFQATTTQVAVHDIEPDRQGVEDGPERCRTGAVGRAEPARREYSRALEAA